jgi:hypothetical protein
LQNSVLCGFDTRTCTSTLLQTTRAIGEYYFWYDQSQTRWESRIESIKAIKFQTPQIREALLQLAKTSEDPKTKNEANCLATYEI